jgi:hypothetical protein
VNAKANKEWKIAKNTFGKYILLIGVYHSTFVVCAVDLAIN